VTPSAAAFFFNVLSPAFVCMEATPDFTSSLSPEAASALRSLRNTSFCEWTIRDTTHSAIDLLTSVSMLLGSQLGLRLGEAMTMFDAVFHRQEENGARADRVRMQLPADLSLMYMYIGGLSAGREKVPVPPWIPDDPFFGPVYERRGPCRTCGLLPGHVIDPPYSFCSLCRDPSVGRFCSKEPCFAAFWRGGHKKECAGRHKVKELIRAQGASNGAGAGAGPGKGE
jgi:hypothetical protein